MDISTRKRVIVLQRAGYSVKAIHDHLLEEGTYVTRRSLYRLCKKFRIKHTVLDLPRGRKQRKLSNEMQVMIDDMLKENDELTSRQIRSKLQEKYPSLSVSLPTVKRERKARGWVCTRPHYCQLIRDNNKSKRLVWCEQQIVNKEKFVNVVFVDESTVQLDHHGRLCFRKQKQARTLKPRPKHPAKVHIWGGISARGATRIVIFGGNMNAIRYGKILEASLVPFLQKYYPDGHRLVQDNDPKHRSNHIKDFFEVHNITWWKTPPESPDLNPIENVWGSLKQYLRTSYKPSNLQEPKDGILDDVDTLYL